MGRDQGQDAGQFEWVNVWASASGATTDVASAGADAEIAVAPSSGPVPPARFIAATARGKARSAPARAAVLPDQLMRDIADIERARDALAAGGIGRRIQTFMLVPARTTDSAPLYIGGVLALVMLTVFGAAAAVSKFGR